MLRSCARNGNEFQTPGHCWLPAKRWDTWFLNYSKSKTRLNFMKLGMLSWAASTCRGKFFVPQTRASHNQRDGSVGNALPLGTERYAKLVWNSWNLACYHGAASTCRGNFFVPFRAGLGISFSQTRASHNMHDGFGRERATFVDETIYVSSNWFQKNSIVNIEQQELCLIQEFSGVRLAFSYINWVSGHECA